MTNNSKRTRADLEKEHWKGIIHDDGVCAWCDYIMQLKNGGYYDFKNQ
jgi:hypothetical protein